MDDMRDKSDHGCRSFPSQHILIDKTKNLYRVTPNIDSTTSLYFSNFEINMLSFTTLFLLSFLFRDLRLDIVLYIHVNKQLIPFFILLPVVHDSVRAQLVSKVAKCLLPRNIMKRCH